MSSIVQASSPHVNEPAAKRFSNCLVVDGVAYLSGMTARSDDMTTINDLDEYHQSKICLQKLQHLIEAAGGVMNDIVKLTIFVTDISRKELVWKAREEAFSGIFPTSSMVQVVALAHPSFKVEIEAVAHIGASNSRRG